VGPRQSPRARRALRRGSRATRRARHHRALVVLSADRPLRRRARVPARAVGRGRSAERDPGVSRPWHGRRLPAGSTPGRWHRGRGGRGRVRLRAVRGVLRAQIPARSPAGRDGGARARRDSENRGLHQAGLVARRKPGVRAGDADQAAVRGVRPGPGSPGCGVESRSPSRGRLRGPGAPDRRRVELAVVRAPPLRPGAADRRPLIQASRGIRPPRSVHRHGAPLVPDMARDSARDSRGRAAAGGTRRGRRQAAVDRAGRAVRSVSPVRAAPEQEPALYAAVAADRRRLRGNGLRPSAGPNARHRGRSSGAGLRDPGERHRARGADELHLAGARRAVRSGVRAPARRLAPSGDHGAHRQGQPGLTGTTTSSR